MKNRILLGTATICMAWPLMAGPIEINPVGPPVVGNSWTYTWGVTGAAGAGVAWFDAFIVSGGDSFASPGLSNFTHTGGPTPIPTFSLYAETSTAAHAGGTGVTDTMTFDQHFSGVINNPGLTTEFFFYTGADAFITSFKFVWDGAVWNGAIPSGDPGTQHPVAGNLIPLPTGAAMAIVGMGVIGVRRRRS